MWKQVVIDNAKAALPGRHALRRAYRKARPYRSLPANDALAMAQGIEMVALARANGLVIERILEVGTGWIPTLPMIWKAAGARSLILTDIEPLCDEATLEHARRLVEAELGKIAEAAGLTVGEAKANLLAPPLHSYRCPPATEDLAPGSIDLIYSRTVLEHIAPELLARLMEEWARLLSPQGASLHLVDHSDHFEHRDKSLSRLNFLTIPDGLWRLACQHPQNYQNRLRHSDYLPLFEAAGLKPVAISGAPDARALEEAKTLPLQPRFQGYEPEDLAVLTSVYLHRPFPAV